MSQRPQDFEEGVEKFLEFHQLDPRSDGRLSSLHLPSQVELWGDALWIAYRSDKWEGVPHDYIHDHDQGTQMYAPLRSSRQNPSSEPIDSPSFIRQASTLVLLGECLGFSFQTPEGETVEAKTRRPHPELYCLPSGRALVILEGKRRVEALIWGRPLRVEARGIVG